MASCSFEALASPPVVASLGPSPGAVVIVGAPPDAQRNLARVAEGTIDRGSGAHRVARQVSAAEQGDTVVLADVGGRPHLPAVPPAEAALREENVGRDGSPGGAGAPRRTWFSRLREALH
jgi:hypothetical protein